jgi:hypothetical protein
MSEANGGESVVTVAVAEFTALRTGFFRYQFRLHWSRSFATISVW